MGVAPLGDGAEPGATDGVAAQGAVESTAGAATPVDMAAATEMGDGTMGDGAGTAAEIPTDMPAAGDPATVTEDPATATRPEATAPVEEMPPDPAGVADVSAPQFLVLQQDWEAQGCSTPGTCHDLDERTIVVKVNPDAARLMVNWAQIAPPEAGGVGVAAAGSVSHFNGTANYDLWLAWQAAGYPFIE